MPREAEDRRNQRAEWRQIASGGGLVAVVAGILFLGAVHETPRAPAASAWETLAPAPLAPVPAPSSVETAPRDEAQEPPAASPTALDPLSRRTLEDPIRLARSSGTFTLQIAVACRRETASRILERASRSAELFVLPATVGGQECFRFCWGTYASRDEAVKAADLPAALRAGMERPGVRRIDEVEP